MLKFNFKCGNLRFFTLVTKLKMKTKLVYKRFFLILVVSFYIQITLSSNGEKSRYEKHGGKFETMFKALASYMNSKLIKTPNHDPNAKVLRVSHREIHFLKTFFDEMLNYKELEENAKNGGEYYWKLRTG